MKCKDCEYWMSEEDVKTIGRCNGIGADIQISGDATHEVFTDDSFFCASFEQEIIIVGDD